jgi:hypothetical protein
MGISRLFDDMNSVGLNASRLTKENVFGTF